MPSQSQAGQSGAQSGRTAAQPTARTAQQVKQSLQQAGFQEVDVVDAAYLIHARTRDGDFVLMLVDPPGGPGATIGAGGQQQSSQSPAQPSGMQQSAQQRLKQSLESAGFKNVAIVDAAFLVNAKTGDGSTVRMTINPPTTWQSGMQQGAGMQQGSGTQQGSGGSTMQQPRQ
jgi:hypothetical protein